ncbi:hypothetical protein [Pseudoalteromonas sp. T1lg23B]|uniref:hypothetical protein n=1 Tax=Pseudoalteromonas sp. T1lg23B TaxID=2077097 RepID=UPI000CF72E5F|nr:hypothetical protein [Pseudoalteromonas sp. T1lg23B]
MQVDPHILEQVEKKLNKQNALKATFAVIFWCIPILVTWNVIFELVPRFSPVMLVISGAAVGFVVRYCGDGYGRRFAFIAFIAHLFLIVFAVNSGIVLYGTNWAMILIGLYILGAWSAAFIARRGIPLLEHKAFYVLMEQQAHESSLKLKNRWFVVFPILLILLPLTMLVTVYSVYFFNSYSYQQEVVESYVQSVERHEAKNIDVTPKSLDAYSTKEALYYAYSYYSGQHINALGRYKGEFPHSPFKAKTILNYLVEHRQDPRSTFILARISEGAKVGMLLNRALEQGDEYAKLYSIFEFGCLSDNDRAMQLLESMKGLAKEQPVISDIEGALDYGFQYVCGDLARSDFELRYIREYSPANRL